MAVILLTPLILSPSGAPAGSDLSYELEETAESVILTVEFPSPQFAEVERQGETYLRVSVPGCGNGGVVGGPLLPVLKRLVEIPSETGFTLTADVMEREEFEIPHPVWPAQAPAVKSSESSSQFIFDREFYTGSSLIPEGWATIEKTGVMREHTLAMLTCRPVRYLPSEGKLVVSRRMRLVLRFTGGLGLDDSEGVGRYASPRLETSMRSIVLNLKSDHASNHKTGYLIIAADSLATRLDPLVEWKRTKGFHTTLISLSEISPPALATAEEIKAIIKNAYESWDPPPSYVLLVGDVNTIPSWTGIYSYLPTDLYYSTMDEDDIFPDLGIGRLSVQTRDAASFVVEKLVDYEMSSWEHGDSWPQRAYFIASDESRVVWEGKTGHEIAESTHTYCMELARAHGMTCDSLWGFYDVGTPIDMAFNDGRSIVVYSGHGSPSGWGGPEFYLWDVSALLTNADMYPLVLSHACLTGAYTQNCYGEGLTNGPDYGALAFLGSSGSTYWYEDDIFQRFIFDALFSGNPHTLSDVVEFAKFGVLGLIDTLWAYEYFEQYNLLGDPSLDIYTDAPHSITVAHPETIPTGPYTLEVRVQDSGLGVENALVSCRGDTIWAGYTDSAGIAMIETEASSGDTAWLTVTGHNLKPYQSEIFTASVDLVEYPQKPPGLALFQNRPNPFREMTEIAYQVSTRGEVALEIYDSTGRIVFRRTEEASPGQGIFAWNGRDNAGRSVPSGMYFFRLKADGNWLTKKMALVR